MWIETTERLPKNFGSYLVNDGQNFYTASWMLVAKQSRKQKIPSSIKEIIELEPKIDYVECFVEYSLGIIDVLYWQEPNFEPGYKSWTPPKNWLDKLYDRLIILKHPFFWKMKLKIIKYQIFHQSWNLRR